MAASYNVDQNVSYSSSPATQQQHIFLEKKQITGPLLSKLLFKLVTSLRIVLRTFAHHKIQDKVDKKWFPFFFVPDFGSLGKIKNPVILVAQPTLYFYDNP